MDTENSQNHKGFVESDITTWSEADYRRLLTEIEPLFLADNGTPSSERADMLFERIEAYEQAHYQIAQWLEKGRLNGTEAQEAPLKQARKRTEASDLVAA